MLIIYCKLSVFIGKYNHSEFSKKQRAWPDHVDIITFYNEVFIPVVKPLLVELGPVGTAMKSNRVPEANAKSDGILSFHIYLLVLKFYLTSLLIALLRAIVLTHAFWAN